PKVNRLMEDLEMPGWDLASLPDDPNLISLTWMEHYANGEPLSSKKIQSLLDRALMHRELLSQAFCNS
ncbi:MAG: polysaccharide pyruvyl transferase CsaB, partial [Nostoc sp.]